ncbi:MAG: putative A/G-specific adenine glycosylase YfhQ [Syntrophorhabdus sp. PtaU1.Bin002]|nr:MAG: putative A/G-specific adenine glycosylase YfhQ [Syntrophorhabdus sp. PtaU1.Bin002]
MVSVDGKRRGVNPKTLTEDEIRAFQRDIYRYYEDHRRDLPWRKTRNPYHILVSEIMLQQTQVERVIEKYGEFIVIFPDVSSLARAPLKDVLSAWQGLGYNRRALALRRTAEIIATAYSGEVPASMEDLSRLPGIGKTTAGEILAFAFNLPVLFIETNIRRVFIHHFFTEESTVTDREIMFLVEATLDRENPRDWYYALMDYGSMLKKDILNPNRRSAHYKKQPAFKNSSRKIRGTILKILLKESPLARDHLQESVGAEPDRVEKILNEMVGEGLVREDNGEYSIA